MGKSKRTPRPVESDKLWYRSLNGIVKLDPVCCSESKVILMDLSDIEEADEDAMPDIEEADEDAMPEDTTVDRYPIDLHITREILYLVNKFCVSRYRIRVKYNHENIHLQLEEALRDFDNNFVKNMKPNLLVRLNEAAIELEIKSLFDITYKAIVDKTKNMDHLLKIFNLPDRTHQLWKDPLVRGILDENAVLGSKQKSHSQDHTRAYLKDVGSVP